MSDETFWRISRPKKCILTRNSLRHEIHELNFNSQSRFSHDDISAQELKVQLLEDYVRNSMKNIEFIFCNFLDFHFIFDYFALVFYVIQIE